MPTHRMKLFALLMGNSTPAEVSTNSDTVTPSERTMSAEQQLSTDAIEQIEQPAAPPTPPSPHYSINLDKLRRIFHALSSLNQNKTTEAEVDDEPLQMRRKYLGIFERFEKKFGSKSNSENIVKRRTLQEHKDRLMAYFHRRNSSAADDDGKVKSNWARNNINRLTSSMRHVKSDSFLARKIRKKPRKMQIEEDGGEHIRLPSMKTKKRSTVKRSKELIDSASQSAHIDLVKHLQENSSQHCLDEIDFWNYDYPFENLVFEGGGAKVHTYIGAIKCLEEAGIKPKRLAGTSAGAITAGLLAVGYTSEEIHILYEYDVEYNVKDGTCGLLSLLPNMFRHYGWNPGERAMRWFGECLAVKTGNPDITFQEILDQYGVELCIVAVNLSNRCEEYFHPKTTPDMPVKLAARMSSSLPGYFQPVRQGSNVYVDGGLLCNYPLHVFDGWWLSMDPDDVFYKKMGSLENLPGLMERKNRFGVYNEQTLGFCMFSMFDDKALRFELEKRHKLKVTKRPKTKLAMKRMKQMKERHAREVTRDTRLDALSRFFRVLRKAHVDSGDDGVKKDVLILEFTKQLSENNDASIEETEVKNSFTRAHADIIFGSDVDLLLLLNDINCNSSGIISSGDLITFLSRNNVDIQSIFGNQFLGRRTEVSNFGAFFMTIQESLMNSARRVYIQTEDLDRTVGINTDYIKMDDFSLDVADQEFLIQQGYTATAAFLRYFIHQHYEKPMTKSQPSSQDTSSLSAEESEYSPAHLYSADSTTLLTDEDVAMTTSTSSKTSRSTKSPSKSTGSQTTQTEEVNAQNDNHDSNFLQEHEEIIVAEIELIPETWGQTETEEAPKNTCHAAIELTSSATCQTDIELTPETTCQSNVELTPEIACQTNIQTTSAVTCQCNTKHAAESKPQTDIQSTDLQLMTINEHSKTSQQSSNSESSTGRSTECAAAGDLTVVTT